jgi:regulatory protein
MKITDIKPQVKRPDRYSVFVDGVYAFALSANDLLTFGIVTGDEFTKEQYEELLNKAVIAKAYDQAIGYIARRVRSEWELREYLKRKECMPNIIEIVIERLRDKKYVDDVAFAEAWVRDRRLLKSTSKQKLTMELRAKRVNDATIQQVLAADETDEHAVLTELIMRKKQQTRYQDKQKLLAYLVGQGFRYDDIKSALQSLEDTDAID